MKLTFKTFALLNEGASDYSISHLEDLDVESFIRAIDKLHDLQAVQKLDGANLRMGLDDNGRMYTSREQKGGKRFFSQKDFPDKSSFDGFRAAHELLTKVEPEVKAILSPGEAVNMEVIYGAQPNTVFYGKDNLNYLAFLEMLPGDDPSKDPDQRKIAKLNQILKGKTVTVKTMASDTTDGEMISRAPRLTDWQVTVSDRVPEHEIKSLDFSGELSSLKNYLKKMNKVASSLGREMTNFEVLKDKSQKLADERQLILDKINEEYKLPIKKKLLDAVVYKQKPSLRGAIDDAGAYSGIEGVIFTDPKTRERFKIVDRDVFTKINKFNYQVRNGIATRTTSVDPNMPLESHGGLVGQARSRSIKLFGLENADLPSQTKKVLAKFKGDSEEETIGNLVDSLHQLNFESIKRKIQSIYAYTLDELDDSLTTFKKNADGYELELPNGSKIKYTKEIRRRTLLTFAEAKKDLLLTLAKIKRTHDMYEIIELFFSKQLSTLSSAGEEE